MMVEQECHYLLPCSLIVYFEKPQVNVLHLFTVGLFNVGSTINR